VALIQFIYIKLNFGKNMTPILNLENVEHLTLMSSKEVKALYSEIIKLPKLKYGHLVNKPEIYIQ